MTVNFVEGSSPLTFYLYLRADKQMISTFRCFLDFSIRREVKELIKVLRDDIYKYQFIFITDRMEHYLKMVNILRTSGGKCNNSNMFCFV